MKTELQKLNEDHHSASEASRNEEIMKCLISFKEYRDVIYTFLDEFLVMQLDSAQTVDQTIVETVEVLREFVLRGGKAISPFLLKLSYEIAGGEVDSKSLVAIGAALELHHKYLLLLDDIADRDEKRYGGPTLEYVYREKLAQQCDVDHNARTLAMLDSSLLISLSKLLVSQAAFPADQLLQCLNTIHQHMSFETLAGWKIHFYQNEESIENSSISQFEKGLELVTARYKFLGPFKVGMILAQNNDESLDVALSTYASCIGTAFQVYDDILGMFGETKSTGKPVGNDVREGKKTLLLQTAYQRANDQEKEFLRSKIGRDLSDEDFNTAQSIVVATGSLDFSRQVAEARVIQGIHALDLIPECEQKNYLISLAQYIIAREK